MEDRMYKVGASLMVANLVNIEADIAALEDAGIDYYHIDIMDGCFVNNFALSPDFIKAIRPLTRKIIDVHLMVQRPERYVDAVAQAGADMISVHAEATPHLQGTLAGIKNIGKKAGVALNPSTPINVLEHIYDVIDFVLIMTVNPGFAGQKFIPAMYDKIKSAHRQIKQKALPIEIEVDGNIGPDSIPRCYDNGANMYVLGTSAAFKKTGTIRENLLNTRKLFSQ